MCVFLHYCATQCLFSCLLVVWFARVYSHGRSYSLTGLITGLLAFGSNGDTVCCYSVFVCVRVRVRAFSFLILYFLLSFDNTQCRDPFLIKAS